MSKHTITGKVGEKVAAKILKSKGFDILFKNYRGNDRIGEIDIVARDGEILCFVEVKTRQKSEFISNTQSDPWLSKKQSVRIENAAKDYLRKIEADRVKYRFDLIEITFAGKFLEKVEHFEGNFGMAQR